MSNPRIRYRLQTGLSGLPAPGGKPLICQIVVNVEAWGFADAMPRTVLPSPHGVRAVPDVPNFSWVEYGMRRGLPRIMQALRARGLPAAVSLNASVIEIYPEAAEAIRGEGWEFVGHGYRQRTLQSEEDERAVIERALSAIAAFTGTRPRGWLGPGLQESFETPDILKAAGVDYVLDWTVDDVPTWLDTAAGRMVAVPYTLDINDSVIYAVERHSSPEMYQRVVDTLSVFDRETAGDPRVLTLALHPHLIGVPHRVVYLEKMLDLLCARRDAVFMTGAQIADWFLAASPPAGEQAGEKRDAG